MKSKNLKYKKHPHKKNWKAQNKSSGFSQKKDKSYFK